jgi:hypothetical protein
MTSSNRKQSSIDLEIRERISEALQVDEAAYSPDFLERTALATSHSTTPGTLFVLAHDKDSLIALAVAANPHTPREAIRRIVTEDGAGHSARMLRRPYLPADAAGQILCAWDQRVSHWDAWSASTNSLWKSALAELPAASQTIVLTESTHLPKQQQRALFQFLAEAPYLTDPAARGLLTSSSPVVRKAVSERTDLSTDVLEETILDSGGAKRRQDFSWLLDPMERAALGTNKSAAKQILAAVASPEKVEENRRDVVAQSGGMWIDPFPVIVCLRTIPDDADVISAVAASTNPDVRALAAVRAIQVDLVAHLEHDDDPNVRAALLLRTDIQSATRQSLTRSMSPADAARYATRLGVEWIPQEISDAPNAEFAFASDIYTAGSHAYGHSHILVDAEHLSASILRRRIVERDDLDNATQIRIAADGDVILASFLADRDELCDDALLLLQQRPEFMILEALSDAGRLPANVEIVWPDGVSEGLQETTLRLGEERLAAIASRVPPSPVQRLVAASLSWALEYDQKTTTRLAQALACHGASLDHDVQIQLAHFGTDAVRSELAWSGGSTLVPAARDCLGTIGDESINKALSRPGRPRKAMPGTRKDCVVLDAELDVEIDLNFGQELNEVWKLGKAESYGYLSSNHRVTFDDTAMMKIVQDDELLKMAGPHLQQAFALRAPLPVVREMIKHPKVLYTQVAIALAYCRFYIVRRELARVLSASDSVLLPDNESEPDSDGVRTNLRVNVLRLLALDEDAGVRDLARRALGEEVDSVSASGNEPGSTIDDLLDRQDQEELLELIGNDDALTSLSSSQQVRIAEHRSVDVPRALAKKSPLLHPETHAALAHSKIFTARRELVRTAGTIIDPALLEQLANDDDEVVQRIARSIRDKP